MTSDSKMTTKLVQVKVDSSVAVVTLNDPDRRNAMSQQMAAEFSSVVGQLRTNPNLRAAILTGAGSAFAAGGDLEMLRKKAALDPETNRTKMLEFYDAFLCIQSLPFPTIAAVNGHAIGAGLCVALACDFRFVAEGAKLGFPFTRLGLHPGMGATCFLPRIIGRDMATDLLVTGRTISAGEAAGLGMFREVRSAEAIMPTALRLAESLAKTGPSAVAGLLKTLRPSSAELKATLEREAAEQSRNYASEEFVEGITAAIEKRSPEF